MDHSHTDFSPPSHLPEPTLQKERLRIVQLDALRGIAAVWVMLYHYTVQYDYEFGHAPGAWYVPQGPRAVELFFMISGFVIPMTLGRTRRLMDFVVSRFSRLYPAFWACLAITAITIACTHWQGPTAYGWDIAFNATMMPHLLFHRPYVDRSYWTLEVELVFYAITALAWLIGSMRGVTAAIAGLTFISLAETLIFRGGISSGFRSVFDSLALMPHIAYFACGYAAYAIRQRKVSAIIVAMLVCAIAGAVLHGGLAQLLSTTVMTAVVIAASHDRVPGLSFAPLLWLGAISYPLYLLHQNLGFILIDAGYKMGANWSAAILIALAGAIAAGTIVSLLIERPAMRWIRSAYRR